MIKKNRTTLHVFDLDETLFHISSRVILRNKDGSFIARLSSKDMIEHKLRSGEWYDYCEYYSADNFFKENPIQRMIDLLNKIHQRVKKTNGSKIIINTARQDLDDKHKFLSKFRYHNIDIDDIHIHRAGNNRNIELVEEKKIIVLKEQLKKNNFKRVCFYDDSLNNLKYVLKFSKKYPKIQFNTYHVQSNGSILSYKGK